MSTMVLAVLLMALCGVLHNCQCAPLVPRLWAVLLKSSKRVRLWASRHPSRSLKGMCSAMHCVMAD